ncbi:BQ2448_6894 [Microbotryum intermedium]|uniref:BQ2448_6894 protein n=1 Tax=Microbotryum intermedium TaxID=269621 RepID=A0A238FJK3_9BASI|nr:BQ2448_6894 [Microbotryum intermedium]
MIDSNSSLNPRIIEVENVEKGITLFTVTDKVLLRSCACEGTITRCILVHGVTSRFPLDVTFCPLSNTGNPCVTYAERLAQIGLMGATASNLYSAFTFQVLQLVESCWAVDPSPVEGMAQGMDDYYGRCGWGDSGALSPHQFQWRNQAAKHDPQATTPDLFISAAEISEMKEAVEKTKTPSKKACTESWIAADDGAEKFWAGKSDTGLVACVCRHDVVLKKVNLEKSGEKTSGARSKNWVLYDIACNLKHHIQKRELLPELAPRLEFATSVFHAFAHQWSCQVEFNPQLISKFGCTDGEGCERLWSSLHSLIPINRPSTRSHRLDNVARRSIELNRSSMDNLGERSHFMMYRWSLKLRTLALFRLGYWMHRKHTHAETKLEQAQACLDRVKESDPRWTESALLLQWEDQRTAQTAKTTAEQDRENKTLRMKMYAILIELHEQDLALFEVGETSDPAVKASHEAKRRAILARFDAGTAGNERASVLDFRCMCSCSIALRHLRSEVIAFQMSQVKLNSMRRGKGGTTLGQRNVAKIKAMGSKGQYQVEKAMKMYNAAVENFRTEASPSFQSVLDGLQLAGGFQSIMSKHETDAFWQDGFFTHCSAEWAIDPLVKEGIHALQSKSRAQEELQRLGADKLSLGLRTQSRTSGRSKKEDRSAVGAFTGSNDETTQAACVMSIIRRTQDFRRRITKWSRNDYFAYVWYHTAEDNEHVPEILGCLGGSFKEQANKRLLRVKLGVRKVATAEHHTTENLTAQTRCLGVTDPAAWLINAQLDYIDQLIRSIDRVPEFEFEGVNITHDDEDPVSDDGSDAY